MSDSQSPMKNGKILIVDDNPANVMLLEKILKKISGATTVTAKNGGIGLDIAKTSDPDLILLDINLPDMSGFEVLKKLRGSEATRKIPIVAVSAAAMPDDVRKGLDAGFSGYLTKPIDIAALAKILKTAKVGMR